MPSRVAVTLDELSTAIRLWIRCAPAFIWKKDMLYEQLKLEKRHDPSREPDPRSDLAAYITDRFALQDWQVTRGESDRGHMPETPLPEPAKDALPVGQEKAQDDRDGGDA